MKCNVGKFGEILQNEYIAHIVIVQAIAANASQGPRTANESPALQTPSWNVLSCKMGGTDGYINFGRIMD